MYRGLTDAVFLGGSANGRLVLYQVKCQFLGTLFQILFDTHHSPIGYFTASLYEEMVRNRTGTAHKSRPCGFILYHIYFCIPSVASVSSPLMVTVNFTLLFSLNTSSQFRNFSTA